MEVEAIVDFLEIKDSLVIHNYLMADALLQFIVLITVLLPIIVWSKKACMLTLLKIRILY